MNPFPYADDNKRYHTWNYHLKHQFGRKVCKIPLNAGFTCPNLDGRKGVGGCTYCSSAGSGDFAGNPEKPLKVQFDEVRAAMAQKWPGALTIPYFQAHTNTYAPLPVLRRCFEEALTFDGVVGLSIATRADCISVQTADYLAELAKRTYLIVELGLQSTFDQTGKRINRCHSYADFLRGYERLQSRGILTCIHLINGLPGETPAMMVENARRVGALHPHAVKLHLLHVLKGTQMADELARGEFALMTLPGYISVVCDQLEVLPPEVILERVTGDGKAEDLIGPLWSLKKFVVMNEIDKELVRRGTMQGSRAAH